MKISTVARTEQVSESETQQQIGIYSSLTSIDEAIDGLVVHYKELATQFPKYQELFEGLAAGMLQQKGQISALRDDIMFESDATSVAQGKEAANSLLNCDDSSVDICPYVDKDEAIISLLQGGDMEAAKEDVESGTTKEEIIAWLNENEEAARDFVSFFEGRAEFDSEGNLSVDDSLTAEEIESWIYDQEFLAEDYEEKFGAQKGDEYIILAKESDDPEEGFLEYRYPDKLMAQGTFFGSQVPTALLSKDENGQWKIEAMTAECSEYKDLLDEQISLLNAE